MNTENRAFTQEELEIISTDNAEIDELKERCKMWRKQASEYKHQHEKDTSLMARLVASEIKSNMLIKKLKEQLGEMLSRIDDYEKQT